MAIRERLMEGKLAKQKMLEKWSRDGFSEFHETIKAKPQRNDSDPMDYGF